MTSNKHAKVFETFILKPLDLIYIVGLIYFLINGAWFIVGFIVLMIVYIGWIGGAIVNKGKSFNELAKGTSPGKWSSYDDELTEEKSWEFARAITHARYAVTLTVIVLTFHFGYKFYISIPLGIVLGFIFGLFSEFFAVFLAVKLKQKT